MVPFRFFVFSLAVYSAIPALFSGVVAGSTALYQGIILSCIQAVGVAVIFRQKSSRLAFTLLILLVLIVAGISIAGDVFFFMMFLMKLYPGPLLAVTFSLVYRFARRSDFANLSRGLNILILVLGSYSILLVLLQLENAAYGSKEVFGSAAFLLGIYEGLSYIPALVLLIIHRGGSEANVLSISGRIIFQYQDITDLFTSLEQEILRQYVSKASGRIHCRDLSRLTSGAEYCKNSGTCKASRCPAYAVIYRSINSLSKKLETMGIGSVVPPENKREIIVKGWSINQCKGVKITNKPQSTFFAGLIPAKIECGSRQPAISGLPSAWFFRFQRGLPFAVALGGAVLISAELFVYSSLPDLVFLFWVCAEIFLLLISLIFRKHRFQKTAMVFSFLGIIFLPFFLVAWIPEISAVMFSLKNCAVFTILQLSRIPLLEIDHDPKRLRELISSAVFWLIWFYMTALIAIELPIPAIAGRLSLVFDVLDRLLLVWLLSSAVVFYSLRPKILTLIDGELLFENRRLVSGLSHANKRILQQFISSQDGILLCRDISKLLDDGRDICGDDDCKPSMCRRYQSLYKRIQILRCYLETTGIGTIISPERKPESYTQGWRFSAYENVIIRRSQKTLISLQTEILSNVVD